MNPSSNAAFKRDLHVVTDDGEQCFMWKDKQLSYIGKDRQELPLVLASKFGRLANKLDLSYNTLTSYRNINLFTNLNELILDNNLFEDDQLDFKQNLRLKTLSLNKNKICDLSKLICKIKVAFPNLEYLSLIGNPLCPSPISFSSSSSSSSHLSHYKAHKIYDIHATDNLNTNLGNELANLSENSNVQLAEDSTDLTYQRYRHFIIYHLPNLRFLDSSRIGQVERDKALTSFFWVEDENHLDSSENWYANWCDG